MPRKGPHRCNLPALAGKRVKELYPPHTPRGFDEKQQCPQPLPASFWWFISPVGTPCLPGPGGASRWPLASSGCQAAGTDSGRRGCPSTAPQRQEHLQAATTG